MTGETLYLNPAMCRLLEVAGPDEMAGHAYQDFFTADSRAAIVQESARRVEGVASHYEVEIVGRRGGRRNVVISGAPLSAAAALDGNTAFSLLATFTDITERRMAEQALARSEERLQRLYDATSRAGLSFDEKQDEMLRLGCEQFGLEAGVLARVTGERYTVTQAVSPGGSVFRKGFACGLSEMFCGAVLAVEGGAVVALGHADEAEAWRAHPARSRFGLQAYFGAPVVTGGRVYGTLSFSSKTPRAGGSAGSGGAPFTRSDEEFLRLMAQWVGGELARQQAEDALHEANAKLHALAATDALTGLKNRRVLAEEMERERERARRHNTPLSVVLLDVDHFKQYNDAFGHPEGDRVLRRLARILSHEVRPTDVVARYGGEEFALVLPGADAPGARDACERFRVAIERAGWTRRAVTASFGIATLAPDTPEMAQLVAEADDALYRAKRAGRNRVRHHGDPEDPPLVEAIPPAAAAAPAISPPAPREKAG